MPLFPFLKSPSVIGLDITHNKIRLVKLQQGKSKIKVEKWISIDLPKEMIGDEKVKPSEEIIALLKNNIKQLQIENMPTAIAMPSRSVMSKRIKFPVYLQKEEYEAEIAMHLNQYFPEIDEPLYFDFVMLKKYQDDYQEVLLFAARQLQIDFYVNMINQSGLRVKIVDIDIYALVRSVQWILKQSVSQWNYTGLLYFHQGFQFILFDGKEIILIQSLSNDLSFIQQISEILQAQSLSLKQLDQCFRVGEFFLEEFCLQDSQEELQEKFKKIDMVPHIIRDGLSEDPTDFLISFGLALRS